MANAITTPSLQINGQYLPIVPNSLSVRRGIGTVDVKAQSNGGSVEPVFQTNQEDAIGYVTFMLEPTDDNINAIAIAQDNNPNNTVQITENNFTRTMANAAVCNDPDLNLGADKNITVEMKGDQVV